MPHVIHETVIEMEGHNRVPLGDITQAVSDSGISTVHCSDLSMLVKEKNLDELARLGDVQGILACVRASLQGSDRISCRCKAFGNYHYIFPPGKSLFRFIWEAFKGPTSLLLLVCAALSLGLGIWKHRPRDGWYDSGSIFVAVFLVILVTSFSNFKQYKKLEEISMISNNMSIQVQGCLTWQDIPISKIAFGDVVYLKIGDKVPADGLFIEGHSLLVNEPSLTGESIPLEVNHHQNPFLLSGSTVIDGYATMVVTCVEMNTTWGKTMSSVSCESTWQTLLQEQLDKLFVLIGSVGVVVGFLLLLVLLVQYFTGNTSDQNGDKEFNGSKTKVVDVIDAVVGITVDAVTIVVVAIPEGLSFMKRHSLAYMMERTMAEQANVRNPSAYEAMGCTTTICIGSTNSLLSNGMKVTHSFIGKESMGGRSYTSIAANVLQVLIQGISLARSSAHKLFTVSPMDDAIYEWAVMKLNVEMGNSTDGLSILDVEASCPWRNRIGISVKRDSGNMIDVHWRGGLERILWLCSHYYDVTGNTIVLDDQERERFRETIENTAAGSVRCIAYGHKLLTEEEYVSEKENGKIPDKNFILLGAVCLEGSSLPGTKRAIETLARAGVKVRMVTDENIFAAKTVATECGILSLWRNKNGLIITGEEFRGYEEAERMEIAEKISILASSSPEDKALMVQCLKNKGHVVAVTADVPNDAPALAEADIGIAMGIRGVEVTRKSPDIVILDKDFSHVSTVVRLGRCVYNNIQKFIQFQLTAIIVALIISLVGAVSTGKTPLAPAQLIWVNLFLDIMASLALAAEEPILTLMNKPPRGRFELLITSIMWRNIIGQAAYQVGVVLTLMFRADSIFGVHSEVIQTLVCNTFVLLQVFNLFNARELEEKNIFKGILKNKLFLGITGITVILLVMVEFLNKFAHTERLDWKHWGICIGIVAFSWPVGWLVKLLPVPKRQMLNAHISSTSVDHEIELVPAQNFPPGHPTVLEC